MLWFLLYKLGVSLHKIISIHLGYGKYLSLKKFIDKRYNQYIEQISSNNSLEDGIKNLQDLPIQNQ